MEIKRLISLGLLIGLMVSATACAAKGADNNTSSDNAADKEESVDTSDGASSANETGDIEADNASSDGTDEASGSPEADTDPSDSIPEEDIPALRDAVPNVLGARIGCSVTGSEIDDPKVWAIITKHFNAVTLGNELKPDALFNYSNSVCPGTQMAELNGEVIEVPVLDFSRAEYMLDKFYDWNKDNPDREIKIRGHVLVWHSQTPEWFFHENYDKNAPYVDSSTMDKRLEWYIREVLTHFTGEESKYKDMFYGWDVVNEAISDSTGTIRTDEEDPNEKLSNDRHGKNSSWYHIYQSDRFILNAFKYANKYAPESLELYYNDYNECNTVKRTGIVSLLNSITEAEGTRIDGMGMQGHYGPDSPGFTDIEYSAKVYSEAVGAIQLTELDISASSDYDGSAEAKEAENEKLKKRYNMIYFTLKNLQSSGGAKVTGITLWGTVDHYSWLQSRSNVGGGNTTGLPQMPLLFDENYEPKPCFWVFAETN